MYVLRDGRPQPVELRPGLNDGASTEVLGGELGEGNEVIVGAAKPGPAGGGFPRGRFF